MSNATKDVSPVLTTYAAIHQTARTHTHLLHNLVLTLTGL